MNYSEIITVRPGILRGIKIIQTDMPQIFDPNGFQMELPNDKKKYIYFYIIEGAKLIVT